MTKDELAKVMAETFTRLQKVREAGQKEYAHDNSNAFGNFERTGKELDIPREKVLWIFMKKHFDGILAHINGHKSQRESVHGRIDDAHVYLELLRGMIIEDGEPVEKVFEVTIPVMGPDDKNWPPVTNEQVKNLSDAIDKDIRKFKEK